MRFDEVLERTVAWYQKNRWWWEPIRSSDYREYYERQYWRAGLMQQLATRLDGLVLVAPAVHGDERGFLMET